MKVQLMTPVIAEGTAYDPLLIAEGTADDASNS